MKKPVNHQKLTNDGWKLHLTQKGFFKEHSKDVTRAVFYYKKLRSIIINPGASVDVADAELFVLSDGKIIHSVNFEPSSA